MGQNIINGAGSIEKIADILDRIGCNKFLLVCDSSYQFLSIREKIDSLPYERAVFSGFTPNPLYEDVCRGVELFKSEQCDAIIAVGGGSSIDVAKCIKLYCKMDPSVNYLTQEYADTDVLLIAIPTTAGTGSESTRYAVIYYEGKKQSVTHESIIPNYAVLDSSVLKTLPIYQKKCTMLDALCQGIESLWSVNSTEQSRDFSMMAVSIIMRHMDAYLEGEDAAAEKIMEAANYAGRAINITQTTAAHAMSYKLTSMYGLPHGHAVAVCLPGVWEYMINNPDKCTDPRGETFLNNVFENIASAMKAETVPDAIGCFGNILRKLEMKFPKSDDRDADIDVLTASVNPIRLKNTPVTLVPDAIRSIYERIVLE